MTEPLLSDRQLSPIVRYRYCHVRATIYKLLDEDASQVHASRASRTIDQDIVSLLRILMCSKGGERIYEAWYPIV